jgi:exopolysaccharide biosynthesis WecB/TagA/CpsF family protein
MAQGKTINLFGYNIVNSNSGTALEAIFNAGRHTVSFLNAHCINVAAKNSTYRWALGKSTVLMPDGVGMNLAARMAGNRFIENLNGTDLFPALMKSAAEQQYKVYFLGSKPGIAEAASHKAQSLAPQLNIAGTRNGFFKPSDEARIIEEINESGADLLLVALGVPMQEIWIARNRHKLNARIVIGVGAQFDFWSGMISRAPDFLRKLGLEWTWRLALEPKRMFKRYVLGNPEFLVRAIVSWLANKTSISFDNCIRRILDLCVAGGALVALAPLVALIGLAIKCESKGPVLFTQIRVGKNGVPFKIYKFRSMYADAEKRRAAILNSSERKGICFKSRNDPRVTRVGKILRRFSLDELPQILNVWKGDMAIVGPRPSLPQEVSQFSEKALARQAAMPGLSGIWQVSGRAEIDFDRMINMDLAYARTKTVFSDLVIISLTFRALLTGRGAY